MSDSPRRGVARRHRLHGVEIPPEPVRGLYKVQLVSGGPWVPARVIEPGEEPGYAAAREGDLDFIDGASRFLLELDGVMKGAVLDEPWDAVGRVPIAAPSEALTWWMKVAMHPISQDEFDYLVSSRKWQDRHGVSPTRRVDLRKLPPVF